MRSGWRDQCFAPHCPGGCAVATSYIGGLSLYSSVGDSTIGAGIDGVGSRGPRGLDGCGIPGGETVLVLIGGGAVDGPDEVLYIDVEGAGEPLPYWG